MEDTIRKKNIIDEEITLLLRVRNILKSAYSKKKFDLKNLSLLPIPMILPITDCHHNSVIKKITFVTQL